MKREWYGVKGLFRWYFKSDGSTDSVEERVVLFKAANFDEAIEMAKNEAKTYCKNDRTANFRIEALGWWSAYLIGEEPKSGVEAFSRLSRTDLDGEAFVRRYYPKGHEG